MKYIINPASWSSMFAVPTEVADKHLRLAGAVQLKALLWLLRHSNDNVDTEDMANDLGLSTADLSDAMYYWIEAGIVVENGNDIVFKKNDKENSDDTVIPERKVNKEKNEEKQKILPVIELVKPTMDQVVARGEEDAEIKFLFNEAQSILGRTIGFDGMSTLLMMHDGYGLPVEVIMMMIQYCKSIGKDSNTYLSRMGKDWGQREIDTIEKADEIISELRAADSLWYEFKRRAGFVNPQPTSSQRKYLSVWYNEYHFDIEMIYAAYEEMANNTTKLSFSYINKVLENWHKDGIKTPEEVENAKKLRKKKSVKKSENGSVPSYDIDGFMEKNEGEEIVYVKKGE